MKNCNDAATRRQHPISVLFFITKAVKDMLYPMIAFLVSTALRDDVHPLWIAGGSALFIIAVVTLGTLAWFRYRYRIENAFMHVEYGLIVRKRLSIPRDRVQTVDTSAGIVHRLFGLQKLVIETAGSRRPEVVLNAVTRDEAERIRKAMVTDASDRMNDAADAGSPAAGADERSAHEAVPAEAGAAGQAEAPSGPVYRVPTGRLVIYSMTTGRVFISLAIIAAIYSQVEDWLRNLKLFDYSVFEAIQPERSSGWIALTAFLLIFLWIIGAAITTVKEYGFTVQRQGNKLLIRRGLLERKQLSVALDRIQAIHVQQNMLRRLFGYASADLVTVASIREDGLTHTMLCPIVPVRELPGLLAAFTPGVEWPDTFAAPGRAARGSYIAMPLIVASVLAAAGLIWIPGSYRWLALALPCYAICLGVLRHRNAGWHLKDDQIVIRFGSFGVQMAFIQRRRIQWLRMKVTPLQARRRLATLQVFTASSGYGFGWKIRHLPQATAADLLFRLRRRHPSPPASPDEPSGSASPVSANLTDSGNS